VPVLEIVPNVFQVNVLAAQIWLLVDDGVTLVDTGLPGSAPRIHRALAAIDRKPADVRRVILTHYHKDHAGDLAAWQPPDEGRRTEDEGILSSFVPRPSSVTVYAHTTEAPYMSGDVPLPNPMVPRPLARATAPFSRWLVPQPGHVDVEVEDGDELPLLGGIRFVHSPGHTRGHLCLYLPAHRLLLSGDSLQVKGGDLTTPSRVYTEDMARARETIGRLAGLDIDRIALSHYRPVVGRADRQLRTLSKRLGTA
jgi:glyoxylase-like metal-dependent hydrolase (beta-lactamase superfamily II)